MNEIVDIDTVRPHMTGRGVCLKCGNEWTAVVAGEESPPLECPECGSMDGLLLPEVITHRQYALIVKQWRAVCDLYWAVYEDLLRECGERNHSLLRIGR